MLALKLGISLNNIKAGGGGGDPIATMIAGFESRVATDGGTFGGSSCLNTILTALNDIS